MRVAILGTGGIGLGTAAVLHERRHHPVLWSPSGLGIQPFETGGELVAEGAVNARFRPETARDPAFLENVDAAIVAVPGYGYRTVFDAVLPHLPAGTPLIISAHLSLAAVFAARRLADRGVEAPVVAWGTTSLLGRKTGPSSVEIGGIRQEVDMACVPEHLSGQALGTCTALFGDRFKLHRDLMAVQLGNLNPPVHMANVLCNLTRIEKGETWSNYGGITPAVARLIEALDRERLAVAETCGVTVRTIERHYELSFGFEAGLSVADMAAEVHRRRDGNPPGPKSLATRYVAEDIPFGIVPLVRIARARGVSVPLHEAGLALFDALFGRDFAADNDMFVDEAATP